MASDIEGTCQTSREARGGAAPAANVYDRGALRNAHEVLFPRSRRRDALARYRAKREKGD